MTDMILYVQFDIKNGALRMLQIPRNSLVTTKNKKITLSNGKTYAATNDVGTVELEERHHQLCNGGNVHIRLDIVLEHQRQLVQDIGNA